MPRPSGRDHFTSFRRGPGTSVFADTSHSGCLPNKAVLVNTIKGSYKTLHIPQDLPPRPKADEFPTNPHGGTFIFALARNFYSVETRRTIDPVPENASSENEGNLAKLKLKRAGDFA